MVEMSVAGIALDASTRSPIVLLRDPSGRRQVPIWIDHAQAQNIQAGLSPQQPPRPLSHEIETDKTPFLAYNNRFYTAAVQARGPGNGTWYSLEAGMVHWVFVSGYETFTAGSPQYAWLQADLASVNRKVTPWLVVVFHEPYANSNYAHQGEGNALMAALESLFDAAGTDLVFSGACAGRARAGVCVCGRGWWEGELGGACGRARNVDRAACSAPLCNATGPTPSRPSPKPSLPPSLLAPHPPPPPPGHVHAYERSYRMRNMKPDATGPYYITIGDGGNREGLASSWISPQPAWSAFRQASYGHGELQTINATHMHWTWHQNPDLEPKVADELWIVKGQQNFDEQRTGVPTFVKGRGPQ